MADIGKSTSAHATEDSAENRAMDHDLQNWGAYLRYQDDPTPDADPKAQALYRMIVERYRETYARDPFNVDDAEETEALIVSAGLSRRHIWVLRMRYIMKLSSRRASGHLSRLGYRCSHPTYLSWLDDTVDMLAKWRSTIRD